MKITHRIILLILFTTLVSTTANVLLTRYQGQELHRDSEQILTTTLTHSLRDAVVQDVINDNKLRVRNLLLDITTQNGPLEFLYVTNHNSEIFSHSFTHGFPRYLLRDSNRQLPRQSGIQLVNKFQTEDDTIIYEYSEVLIPGLDTELHIGINQTHISELLSKSNQFTLVMSAVITITVLFIAFTFSRQLTAPLNAFAKQIQLLGAGKNLNLKSFNNSDPDIRQLARVLERASKERQAALNSLQERETNLSITLNSIGDAVIATDHHGKVTRMNPVAEKLTGWTMDEARGISLKTVFPIIDATTRQTIENPVDKVLGSGEIVFLSNHTTLIAKDGTEYQIADSAAPIRDKFGNILGIVLVFNNVTEQYKLREDADKNRRNLQAIMDHSPAVIYVKDLEDRFVFINKQFEILANRPSNEIIGKSSYDLFPQEDVDEMRRNDVTVLNTRHTLESKEHISLENEIRTFHSTKFPLFDEHRNIYAICGISTDITEREQQEEQLRRTQKMDTLGKLTGGIAHDYNNILGIVMGYAELLEAHIGKNSELADYVHEIYHAGERGSNLTKKLLSFSRKTPTEAEIVNINTLLQGEKEMLERTLTPRIKLQLHLDNNLKLVYLDSSELEDAIINLSINAMHAIDGSGELTIKTYNEYVSESDEKELSLHSGNYTVLSIADSGRGMDKETQQKIFEPFFTTKGEQGTGLGLSQVYGFVERSNGIIRVYSRPGHGTRFVIYFPCFEDDEAVSSDKKKRDSANLRGEENILVVDDEPSLLFLAEEILEPFGYRVFSAESAKQALNILQNNKIDLLLSDIIMPETDGYELAAIVKKQYPNVKIQLVSGFNDEQHIHLVDQQLTDNLILKPYHSNTLLKRIRHLLDYESHTEGA